ncbi:hypothetical protein CHCC20335_0840 [Bacillus paralicheniformis]|nr:hypothetical protein CHCC20335_0840 [Bacillus paralicheniformis]
MKSLWLFSEVHFPDKTCSPVFFPEGRGKSLSQYENGFIV